MIHRDLKPANVLISTIEGEDYYYLCDFGLSKIVDFSTSVVGTPQYTAPDIVSGSEHQTFGADYWSFGVMIYEMATPAVLPMASSDPTKFPQAAWFDAFINVCAYSRDLCFMVQRDPGLRFIPETPNFPWLPEVLPLLPMPFQGAQTEEEEEEAEEEEADHSPPLPEVSKGRVKDLNRTGIKREREVSSQPSTAERRIGRTARATREK